MDSVGFYAGSFDPFTRGHLSIVCEALCQFDRVIVAVGHNPAKKAVFTPDERKKMIYDTLDDLIEAECHQDLKPGQLTETERLALTRYKENPDVISVIDYQDLTVDAALRSGAQSLIRGERLVGDHDAEMQLSMLNAQLLEARHCRLNTVIIPVPKESLTYVSSSCVKSLFAMGEYIAAMRFVTPSVHNEMCRKYLKADFPQIFFLRPCSDEANEVYDALVKAYCAPGRYYHNLSHIAYGLNYLKFMHALKPGYFSDVSILRLALFFHDIVNGEEDSEQKSAEKLFYYVGEISAKVEQAAELIMATKHEDVEIPDSEEAKVIRDLDLLILADRRNYEWYAGQVCREYASKCRREDYARGRKAFLTQLLSHDIFCHEFFKPLEEDARRNIRKELALW